MEPAAINWDPVGVVYEIGGWMISDRRPRPRFDDGAVELAPLGHETLQWVITVIAQNRRFT